MEKRDWYVKWFATVMIMLAVICRSVEEVPRIYDVLFSTFGTVGWLYVSIVWKDRALILLNGSMSIMLAASLLRYLI